MPQEHSCNIFQKKNWMVNCGKLFLNSINSDRAGRGQFELCASTVNSESLESEWTSNICFVAFDVPHRIEPFENRMQILEELVVEYQRKGGKRLLQEISLIVPFVRLWQIPVNCKTRAMSQ
jgi:hypothetical protein